MRRKRPTWMGRDLGTSLAALFALLPGFVFPFVLSWSIGVSLSDRLLLAVSVSITLIAVIGSAIEANTVSEIGRAIGTGVAPNRQDLRRYELRVLRFAALVTMLVGTALITLYSLGVSDVGSFVPLAAMVLAVPMLGALASVRSGQLIAHGQVSLTICLQASRMLVPLLVVLCWREAPLAAIAGGYVVGELIRLFTLSIAARPLGRTQSGPSVELPTRGLIWQSASLLTAHGGPVTDRVFLAGAPAGSLTAYEMADKLFFAATQFLNLGFLVRRMSGWSRLPSVPVAEGRLRLRRDLTVLVGVAGVTALLVLGGALVASRLTFLPSAWHQGLVWAAILSVSLPMIMVSMCGGRLLIIGRRQHLLIRLSAISVAANAVLDWIFFGIFGPVGIPVATVLVRTLSAVLYLIVVRRAIQGIIGSELAGADDVEQQRSLAAPGR